MAPALTEEQLLGLVIQLCSKMGLLWKHDPDSRQVRSVRGFPDLVIAGPRGVIFRELKPASGQTSAHQDLWIWTLCKSGASCEVWRPDDWHSGRIRETLERLA